jgi:TfoX N-terminal domain
MVIHMPRDPGLEELVHGTLGDLPGLSEKAMFGGWAFLLYGNLLCGARRGSLMLRVGSDNEVWALHTPGVEPVEMRGRRMNGYVRASSEAYANDGVRQRLIDAAVSFTLSLPKK